MVFSVQPFFPLLIINLDNLTRNKLSSLRLEPIIANDKGITNALFKHRLAPGPITVKIRYKERSWDRAVLFVIAVFCYNCKDLCTKVTFWDHKFQLYIFFIAVKSL